MEVVAMSRRESGKGGHLTLLLRDSMPFIFDSWTERGFINNLHQDRGEFSKRLRVAVTNLQTSQSLDNPLVVQRKTVRLRFVSCGVG